MSRIEGLIGVLVERYSLSRQEAEEFVTSIFGVVRENLDRDKIVKVKGLGTFKLADISARESIDVNTKERIVIEGRAKISFTPENAVRDRINSPFSQFETVDLDEDMDFSSIDDKYNEKEEQETTLVDNAIEIEKEQVINDAPTPETDKEEEPTLEEPTPEEVAPEEPALEEPSLEEPVSEEPAPEEKKVEESVSEEQKEAVSVVSEKHDKEPSPEEPKQEEPTPEEPKQEAVVSEEPKQETVVSDSEEKPKATQAAPQMTVPARNPFCEELIREGITHNKEIIRLLYLLLALVIIVLLIGAVCLGYKMGANAALKDVAPIKPAPHKVVVVKKKPAVITPVAVSAPADTVKPVKQETQEKQETKKPDSLDLMQAEYNKDARVRTGAYIIVGLDKVIKVREGQTFESICRHSLGEGMECYVEVFNGGKKEYKAGDEIKIPLLKLKKRMR